MAILAYSCELFNDVPIIIYGFVRWIALPSRDFQGHGTGGRDAPRRGAAIPAGVRVCCG